jgi:hypothetical protein
MPIRELKNLAPTLAAADEWGLDAKQLGELIKRIKVSVEWAEPPAEREPISFFRWVLADAERCPPLHFALTEHSFTYVNDTRFERMGYEEWLEFCNIHCVFDHEFRPAWRRWASQHRRGPQLVN